MKDFIKYLFISNILILITACSSDDTTIPPGSDGYGTGEINEVILTLQNTDINSFDIESFTQDIANASNASVNQIVITSVNGFTRSGIYVSFYFEDSEEPGGLSASSCLTNIQQELNDGMIAGFNAEIIIMNTDELFNCIFDTDCAGICNGNSETDECGICNGNGPLENYDCEGNCTIQVDCAGACGGSAEYDICDVCNGNGSSCDEGQIVGTYRLYKMDIYNYGDCMGSPDFSINGPNFNNLINDSYGSGCSYENIYYNLTNGYFLLDIQSNGNYNFLFGGDYNEDYEYCDDYNDCSNGECSYCNSRLLNINELTIETGSWSIENNYLDFDLISTYQILTGSRNGYSSECGEINDYSNEYDGCRFNEWDYSSYLNENNNAQEYTLNGNTLVINNAYFYSDGIEEDCRRFEFRKASLPNLAGCTDSESSNYNPFATSNNGTCDEGYCDDTRYGYYHNEDKKTFIESFLKKRNQLKNDK